MRISRVPSTMRSGGSTVARSRAPTRRTLLGLVAGAGVAGTALAIQSKGNVSASSSDVAVAATPPRIRPPGESLGVLAADAGIVFGASIADDVFEDTNYRNLYLEQARIVTSDLALKMLILRPDEGAPRYDDADRLVDFAAAHQMKFRGHTLIWNENNPGWMKRLSKTEVGVLMDRHIDETVSRYAGKIQSWDVVNEPFWPDHGAPGGYRKGPWYDAMGPAYIARALTRAARADPAAKIVVNEAFTERGDGLGLAVRAGMLKLIDDLQHQGVPLHAIGLESHLQPQYRTDDEGFSVFLDQIAQRGLDVYISELDIDDSSLTTDIARRDRIAGDRVGVFLNRALACPAVKIVECWQLSDRYSWFADPAMRRRNGDLARPLPFDRDFKPKPMYDAIAEAFIGRRKAQAAPTRPGTTINH